MPTIIVQKKSDAADGKISRKDLLQTIKNFQDVSLIKTTAGKKIKKTGGIEIPFWIMKKLIDDSFDADGGENGGVDFKFVNIRFAISLPGQLSCEDESDVSNSLTAVVNIGKRGKKGKMEQRDKTDDQIITLGFKPQQEEIKSIAARFEKASIKARMASPAPANNAIPQFGQSDALPNCCGHPTT